MIKVEKSYGIILIIRGEKDRFLIFKNNDGHWSFPKSHSFKKESSKNTVLRELKEKTGITEIEFTILPNILEEYEFERNYQKIYKINEYFIGFTTQKEEISEYKWATYNEALEIFTFDSPKEILSLVEEYINENGIYKKIASINSCSLSKDEINKLPVFYGNRNIVVHENKILLIKTKKGIHNLIGGQIKKGETILESLIRECKEETGYDIDNIIPIGYIELIRRTHKRYIFSFVVKTSGAKDALELTKEEINLGHEVFEYKRKEALNILKEDIKKDKGMASSRSLLLLEEAQEYLNEK
ncbi:MAG: NUDIX hydrolase [Patescibacteria group bacterium]|nr:NUDIX hydrolase [Patescibacteria group bacterium]